MYVVYTNIEVVAIQGSLLYCWNTGIQENRNTGIQEYMNTEIQEYRNTRIQEYRNTSIQKYGNTGIQEYRIHEYRNKGIQEYAGIQECRNTGIQEYKNRNTGIQEYRNTGKYILLIGKEQSTEENKWYVRGQFKQIVSFSSNIMRVVGSGSSRDYLHYAEWWVVVVQEIIYIMLSGG